MSNIRLKQVKPSYGFTLIELLIVMAILLLLLGSVMLSVQTLSGHWRRSVERQQDIISEYKNIDVLASALHSIVPIQVKNAKGLSGFYFLGREEGFTAVTASGILNAGRLSVFRLLKEKQQDGSFSLYYEEAPLNDYPLVYAEQQHNFNFRFLVVANVNTLNFSYYGWSSYAAYQLYNSDLTPDKDVIWQSAFDGMVIRFQPERLAIQLDSTKWVIDFPQRTQFLQSRGSELNGV